MAGKGAKSNATLQARIKRMMQSDEDVGKVAKASPVLIAKALDVFLQGMVEGAAAIATGRGAKMLTASHIKAHVQGEVLLDFLKDAVEGVPDLPPEGAEKPKGKRQRSKAAAADDGTSPPKARSRGGRGGGERNGRSRGKKGAAAAEAAAAGDEGQQAGAMDVDGAAAGAAGGPAGDAEPDAEAQEQQEQEQAGEEQQPQAADPAPAAEDAAAAEEGGEAAAVAPVSIPGFLAGAAALPGAEAEEEDYDE